MAGSGRALEISGWLVAAAVAIMYVTARYDFAIQERKPAPAVSAAQDEVKPVADDRYADLEVEVQVAAGADLLTVDRRLEAAERASPSDYRFTYERAKLAVYGRAEHHEAFFHLFKAAEKAIGTERAPEMMDRLERDGAPAGRLRRLAVGHDEWSVLHEALEHRDRDRLWHQHTSHRTVASTPTHQTEEGVVARVSVASSLERETPCVGALHALRQVPIDPEAEGRYHRLRELCLSGSGTMP